MSFEQAHRIADAYQVIDGIKSSFGREGIVKELGKTVAYVAIFLALGCLVLSWPLTLGTFGSAFGLAMGTQFILKMIFLFSALLRLR